jgi:hypothetical protein
MNSNSVVSGSIAATAAIFLAIFAACGEQGRQTRQSVEARERVVLLSKLPVFALAESRIASGQKVYVPTYPRIFVGADMTMPLTTSLSIRNTDADHPIVITSVRSYASSGNLMGEYLDGGPVQLGPMATAMQPVARSDLFSHQEANFIVEWVSSQPVSEPIIESVMVRETQGLAFLSRGKVIDER